MTVPLPYGYQDPLGNTEQRLILPQGNDATLTFTVTDPNNDNAVVPLVGASIVFVRKLNRYVPDDDPSAIIYEGSLTQPSDGICAVFVPGADNDVPAVTWWRLDVELGGENRTANYGPLQIMAV